MKSEKSSEFNYLMIGIVIIFLIGSFMHFAYALSGKSFFIGLIAATNESTFEHLKLFFYPSLLYWILGYIILSRFKSIKLYNWIQGMCSSLVAGPVFIAAAFYTVTSGFNLHSLFLDIFIFFVAVVISQLLGFHIYNKGNADSSDFLLCVFIIILLIFMYTRFTVSPPNFPIFIDMSTSAS